MPFAYYGAKHGLASQYPRPRHQVIVEPFAGSAAYACYHAHRIDHAVLIDSDPAVVMLWHELQEMTPADVDLIGRQLEQDRISHALLAGMGGSSTIAGVFGGKTRATTPRMRESWPTVSARIKRALPHIKRWQISHGTYTDAPNIEATWFVDPPYQVHGSMAGAGYRQPSSLLDFGELGDWCRGRQGFTMVCEQSPAEWLPFHPFATQSNGTSSSIATRHELIWRSDLEQPTLWAAV